MLLYILGFALLIGLGAVLWRQRHNISGARRDLAFIVDLIATALTALVVGSIVSMQLQRTDDPSDAGRAAAVVEPAATVEVPVRAVSPTTRAGRTPAPTATAQAERTADVEDRATSTPRATREATRTPRATREATRTPRATASPEATATATAEPTATAAPTATVAPTTPPAPVTRTYIVQAGDRLGTISQRYGLTNAQIIAANPGIDPDNLRVGAVLTIPGGTAPAPVTGTTYTVQLGDVFTAIASRFGVTTQQLAAANPGITPESLRPGQVLQIPSR